MIKKVFPYIWQPAIACSYMLTVLYVMSLASTSVVLGAIGASSLASTAYILFSNPHSATARVLQVWGGYTIGIVSGLVCFYMARFYMHHHPSMSMLQMYTICGAVAIALAMSVMCVCQLRHPPAAGMALGLVLEPWDYPTLFVVFMAIAAISILKKILQPYLKPL